MVHLAASHPIRLYQYTPYVNKVWIRQRVIVRLGGVRWGRGVCLGALSRQAGQRSVNLTGLIVVLAIDL
jgi:hypothetical protein